MRTSWSVVLVAESNIWAGMNEGQRKSNPFVCSNKGSGRWYKRCATKFLKNLITFLVLSLSFETPSEAFLAL